VRQSWRGSNPRRPTPEEWGTPALTSRPRRVQLERQAQWQPRRATTRPPAHALISPVLRARRQPGECSRTCILIHFSRTGKRRLCCGDSFRPGGPGLRTGPGRKREDPDVVTWIRGANFSRDRRSWGAWQWVRDEGGGRGKSGERRAVVLPCLGLCVTAARPTLDNWCCPATTGVEQRVMSGSSTGPEQPSAPPGAGLA
jgi:hypothetical protein